MKSLTHLIISTAFIANISAYAGNKIPPACQEYIKLSEQYIQKNPEYADLAKEELKKTKRKWSNIPKGYEKTINEECKLQVAQLKPMV